MRPADLARAEWALNETVVEGTAGTLRLLTDGSLEWIGPTGRRERKPVILPLDYQVYIDGYVATQQHFVSGLITGAEHETQATDTLRTDGRRLDGLPLGRGGPHLRGFLTLPDCRLAVSEAHQ